MRKQRSSQPDLFEGQLSQEALAFFDAPPELQANLIRSLTELGLSRRARNALSRDIRLVGDLVQVPRYEIARLRGIGKASVNEIEASVDALGLRLGMTLKGWPLDDPVKWRALRGPELSVIRKQAFLSLLPAARRGSHFLEDELEVLKSFAGSARNGKILLAYCGISGRAATLSEVGKDYGLTRERVRQIVSNASSRLRARVFRPPRLCRAVRYIAARSPMSLEEAEQCLVQARIARSRVPMMCCVRLYRLVTGSAPRAAIIRCGTALCVVDRKTTPRIDVLISESRRRISSRGVATVSDVVRWANDSKGITSTAPLLRSLLASLSVAWLDDEAEWFTLPHAARNRLRTICRKVVATAARVDVRVLREGVRRHFHMRGVAPPSRVLARFVDLFPWCKRHDNIVEYRAEVSEGPLLSSTEQVLAQVLRRHGPAMIGTDLVREGMVLGAGQVSLEVALSHSPILSRVAPSIYALRGNSIDPGLVADLQSRIRREESTVDFGWGPHRTMWIMFRITTAILRTGIMPMPAGVRKQANDRYAITGRDGEPSLSLRIGGSNSWGIKRLLSEARVGDAVMIVLNNKAGTATVVVDTEVAIIERIRKMGT